MTLALDSRQRAMLEEMGVRVWAPPTRSASAPVSVPVSATKPEVALRPPPPASTPAGTNANLAHLEWAALQAAVQDCHACGLCQTRKRTVFGVGGLDAVTPGTAPRADWLFVGEAPGEQEDASGEPFVGAAGQLLDNMLRAITLERNRAAAPPGVIGQAAQGVFIANVLKCRPPGNRNPEPAEVEQCAPYLQRQIELLQPKVIVALGRFAAHALLQESAPELHSEPLGRLRGRVHTYRGIPVVVTYHPAYLLRALGDKSKAWADLCLALMHYHHASNITL